MHLLSLSHAEFLTSGQEVLSYIQTVELDDFITKRRSGVPLAYLIGEWDFYGATYKVGSGVLIPRSDTETIIDVMLAYYPNREALLNVIDLCSGTGCIGITLANLYKNAEFKALEYSKEAYAYLEENIRKLSEFKNIAPILGDVRESKTSEKFDVIVSNPPYISKNELEFMEGDLGFEPESALFAEDDGLFFYKKITHEWNKNLLPGGMLIFEIGFNQSEDVEKIILNAGFTDVVKHKDLSGNFRVISGTKE